MDIEDLKDILAAIRDGKEVLIPYQVHDDIRTMIHAFGGVSATFNVFMDISNAEPPEFR